MDVPAKIILAKFAVVLGARIDDVVKRVETKIPSFTKLPAKDRNFDSATQCPHSIDERKIGQFVPGGTKVQNLVVALRPQKVDGGIADQQRKIRQRSEVV